MKTAYTSWLARVRQRLIHADALSCTAGNSDMVLRTWHRFGFTPSQVAARLNERWRVKRERESSRLEVHCDA